MAADDGSREDMLDETLDETFPASDAPANTVETGIRVGEPPEPSGPLISDNTARNRFELVVDGETAFLTYERTRDTLTLVHTEVPAGARGQHLGGRLVDFAVSAGHAAGLRLVVICPFARAYLRKRRTGA